MVKQAADKAGTEAVAAAQDRRRAIIAAVLLTFVGFIAGGIGMGWPAPFVIALMVAYDGWHRHKADKLRQKMQLRAQAHNYENLRALCPPLTVPPWIDYSDIEQCGWLRDLFLQLWPYARISTEDVMKLSLNRVFDAIRPGFLSKLELTTFDIKASPEILGVNTVRQEDESFLDLPLRIRGDSDIVITAATAGVELKVKLIDLEVSGTLRLMFTELSDTLPCFNAVCISFVNKPDVDFSLQTARVPLTAIPGLANFLEEMIKDQISAYVVWPKKVVVPLIYPEVIPAEVKDKMTPEQIDQKEKDNKAAYLEQYNAIMDRQMDVSGTGFLRVTVVEASGLKNTDLLGKSDPYCVLFVGAQKAKTKVCKNQLDPVWNERFEWIISDLSTQILTIKIKDDDVGINTLLGMIEVSLSNLQPSTITRRTLDLEHGQGTLTLELEYKPFIDTAPSAAPVLGPEWDPIDNEGVYHNGCLFAILKCLDGMSGDKPTFVTLNIDGQSYESWPGYRAAPPLPNDQVFFEQDFAFPLTAITEPDGTSKKLSVTLTGANTGTVEIDIVNEVLVYGTDGTIEWFDLEGGDGGRVRLSLSVKYVSPEASQMERRKSRAEIQQNRTARNQESDGVDSDVDEHSESAKQYATMPAVKAFGALLAAFIAGHFWGMFSIVGLVIVFVVAAGYAYVQSLTRYNYTATKDLPVQFCREKILEDKVNGAAHLMRKLQDLPPWMTFPNVEKNEWLNELVDGLWPHIRAAANKTIDDSVNPILDGVRPSFLNLLKLETDLGATPPLFAGVSHYQRSQQGEQVILDMELNWAGDTKAVVHVGAGPVQFDVTVKDLCINGMLRIRLGPLITMYPCFSDMGISFSTKPYVNFTAQLGIIPLTSIPGINSEIQHAVQNILESSLLWPTEIPVNIVDPVDVAKLKKVFKQTAVGILRVIIRRARGVKNVDGPFGKSDPYASLVLHSHTPVKQKTKTIKNDLNPEWNEAFEFLIEAGEPMFVINIKDSDRIGHNHLLGNVDIELSDLPPDVLVKGREVPLMNGGKQHGSVDFDIEYKPFSASSQQVEPFSEEIVEGSGKEFGWSTGVAFLNVVDGVNFPGGGSDGPDSYVTATIGSVTHKTESIKNNRNPSFNSLLSCTVKDFSLQVMRVEVKDKNFGRGDTVIGRYMFRLADVIRSGTVQGQYALEDSPRGTNPELNMMVTVKSVDDRQGEVDFEAAKALRAKRDAEPAETAGADGAALLAGAETEDADASVITSRSVDLDDVGALAQQPKSKAPSIKGPGILRVDVEACTNLPRTDSHGFTDAYVSVRVGRTKFNTSVAKKNCNPTWREGKDFHVNDPNQTMVLVKVKDESFFGNRLLGVATVPISDFGPLPVSKTYPLDMTGVQFTPLSASKPSTVTLQLGFYPDPEDESQSESPRKSASKTNSPRKSAHKAPSTVTSPTRSVTEL
eukprot:m.126394 g.126394  ORF g.126394 m.126394 type:complete len:1440 (-) comp16680_c0_seq2:53-4372(-)